MSGCLAEKVSDALIKGGFSPEITPHNALLTMHREGIMVLISKKS
jgi:hypothetical protein